jgi:hypothetical protein
MRRPTGSGRLLLQKQGPWLIDRHYAVLGLFLFYLSEAVFHRPLDLAVVARTIVNLFWRFNDGTNYGPESERT